MIIGEQDAEPSGADTSIASATAPDQPAAPDQGPAAASPLPPLPGPPMHGARTHWAQMHWARTHWARTHWGRMYCALPLALVSGLLMACAFAPISAWPLAVVGPALLVVLLYGRSLRGSFVIGLVFGIAFFLPLLAWVVNLAWYAWVALAVASALIFAVFVIAQRLLLNLRWWPLAVAGWWVAAEAFRDRWPWGGFPWGRLGMSQAGLATQGWAAIGGVPVLSFAVALTATTLAWIGIAWLAGDSTVPADRNTGTADRNSGTADRHSGRGRRTWIAAAGFAATAGLSCLPAALPLDSVPANAATATVAAIQGNVPRARSVQAQVDEVQVTANHAQATDELAARVDAGTAAAPDLVIWPENSTSIDPTLDPSIYAEISNAASAINRPILVGAVLENPKLNAGVLWEPGKGPTTIYAKRQLVPFGEYLPLRGLISKISSLTALLPTDFTPGHQTVVFRVGQIRLGDVICYEVAFDGLVRSEVAAGANLLSVQSNDATFEREGPIGEESGQQLAMARIRAVEFDRAVVVASTTGYSAVIAPDGQVTQRTGLWTQAELEAKVPLLTSTTLAERVGDWPEWVIVIATAIAFLLAVSRAVAAWRQRRKGQPAAAA